MQLIITGLQCTAHFRNILHMIEASELVKIPFFKDLPEWVLTEFANEAVEKNFEHNEFIMSQHDEAISVFFLLSGSVDFHLRFEGVDDMLVGATQEFGAVLGWSVFRPPYRYTAAVRCEVPCRFIEIPRDIFEKVFEKDPCLGYEILKRVAVTVANRLEQTRNLLVMSPDEIRPEGESQE